MKANHNKIRNVIILTAAVFMVLAGCKKNILTNADKANLDEITQWASDGDADIFLNDIYNSLPNIYNSPENLDNFTDDNDAGQYYSSWNFKQGIVD